MPAEPTRPPTKTPAGGQINADWGDLGLGVEAFALFVRSGALDVEENKDWHVIFRCGTVVRVVSGEPEWGGYSSAAPRYEFPEHRVDEKDTVVDIMADNELVWNAQCSLAPPPVGRAVRQAFAKLVGQGYPYPGGPPSDRSPIPSGVVDETVGMLWHVYWPNLDRAGRVFNLAFSMKGAAVAAMLGGELRRYDYMFPEVAAVLTPALALWKYNAEGVFAEAPALER